MICMHKLEGNAVLINWNNKSEGNLVWQTVTMNSNRDNVVFTLKNTYLLRTVTVDTDEKDSRS